MSEYPSTRKSSFPATEPTMSIHLVLSFENHPSLSVLSALAVIDGVEVKGQKRKELAIRPPRLPA